MNDRIYDTVETPCYRLPTYQPREYIPIAVFDAMTHAERREIVNVAPLVAAIANIAREAEVQTERAS